MFQVGLGSIILIQTKINPFEQCHQTWIKLVDTSPLYVPEKNLLISVTSLPFIKTISLQTCRCLLFFWSIYLSAIIFINNKSCYFHFKNHKQLLFSKLVFHVKVDTKHREGGVMFLLNQPNSF